MADKRSISWLPSCFHLLTANATHVTGWVENDTHLKTVLECHKRHIPVSFSYLHDDGKEKTKSTQRLYWNNVLLKEDTIPFSVRRTRILQCHYGSQHKRDNKRKRKDEKEEKRSVLQRSNKDHSMVGAKIPLGSLVVKNHLFQASCPTDHSYRKGKRKRLQTTRKVGCMAKIVIKYLECYPAYSVNDKNRYKRQDMLAMLKEDLHRSDSAPLPDQRIHINLPLQNAHSNHIVCPEAAFANRVHPKIIEKIYDFVENGIISMPYIRRALRYYVQRELSKDDNVKPQMYDRAYYPTKSDIRNHVHKALVAGRYSDLDQEELKEKVKLWRKSCPSSKFFFRQCTSGDNVGEQIKKAPIKAEDHGYTVESDEEDEGDDTSQNFLFIHMEAWQQKLLIKYGNILVLLDATYKTTKYSMPLFLLCVRSNVNYIPVAEFICQDETTLSITEALQQISSWNPGWQPPYFMTDYSDSEYQAIKNVFPNAKVYLCAFHREQAWERWSKRIENGLDETGREQFLTLMRKIAHAATNLSYLTAVESLKQWDVFRSNKHVKNYVTNKWLDVSKMSVTTNNGVEALNRSLKQIYLDLSSTGSVTHTIEIIINEFIKDLFETYCITNYKCSEQYRQYSSEVPDFLRNRPQQVVHHCLDRMEKSKCFSQSDITRKNNNTFYVQSRNEPSRLYEVFLGSECYPPNCDCEDFRKAFLPCKHIMALLQHNFAKWHDISEAYISSPYLNIDIEILSSTVGKSIQAKSDFTEYPKDISPIKSSEDISPIHLSDDPSYELHKEKSLSVATSRNLLRESIKQLEDVCFLCQDSTVLLKARQTVKSIRTEMLASCPKDHGIPLEEEHLIRRRGSAKHLRPLPQRKKRKKAKVEKYQKRVGYKANVMRKAMNININGDAVVTDKGSEVERLDKDLGTKQLQRIHKNKTMPKVKVKLPLKKRLHLTKCSTQDDDGTSENNTDAKTLEKADSILPKPKDFVEAAEEENTDDEITDDEHGRALQLIWNSAPDDTPVLSIGPYVITRNSFHTLQNTLGDEIIDAYLMLLTRGYNTLHINCVVCTAIFEGAGNREIHNLLRNENLYDYDSCIGVINEGGNHWTLVIIEPKEKALTYINPLGELRRNENSVLMHWYAFLNERYAKNIDSERSGTWTIKKAIHSKQMDGISCGVYVLKFAEQYLKGRSFILGWNVSSILKERRRIGRQLLAERINVSVASGKSAFKKGIKQALLNDDSSLANTTISPVCGMEGVTSSPGKDDSRDTSSPAQRPDGKDHLPYDLRQKKRKRKRSSFVYPSIIKKKRKMLYCKCQKPYDNRRLMVFCDSCMDWFHLDCIGLEKKDIPGKREKFFCPDCQTDNVEPSPSGVTRHLDDQSFKSILDYLYAIMECSDRNCHKPEHRRHHHYLRMPLRMHNKEKKRAGFGHSHFNSEFVESFGERLTESLMTHRLKNSSTPYTGGQYSTIKNLDTDSMLWKFLYEHEIFTTNYIIDVLLKESLIFLSLEGGATYEEVNKMLLTSEIDFAQVLQRR